MKLNDALLASIATQLMSGNEVVVDSRALPVGRTSSQKLRTVTFSSAGQTYQAIEQNPEKPSRWGKLARSGHHVVQFKDTATNRFVAVAVDGKVMVYGRRHDS